MSCIGKRHARMPSAGSVHWMMSMNCFLMKSIRLMATAPSCAIAHRECYAQSRTRVNPGAGSTIPLPQETRYMSTDSVMESGDDKRRELRAAALESHEWPTPGKGAIHATKQLLNQHDLALAYSPGVAAPCEEIVKDPNNAFRYTARGNLVAVITNGTAVLGLGDFGPLAAKPVMEGKGVLFKKFAGIDVFDIEVNEKQDLDKLVDVIAALEPTFGGINLEDIKAPDCFYVERKLRERMKIPVFHDDQHGTAITVGAAILNGLKVASKDIRKVKLE